MQAGLVIYARSKAALAQFYSAVFALEPLVSDAGSVQLCRGGVELVILETAVSRQGSPVAAPRENVAIKPTFFVDIPLDVLQVRIRAQGGEVFAPKPWMMDGRTVCDACDCEGNIFQLRIGPAPEST